jgi:hypothetical protein
MTTVPFVIENQPPHEIRHCVARLSRQRVPAGCLLPLAFDSSEQIELLCVSTLLVTTIVPVAHASLPDSGRESPLKRHKPGHLMGRDSLASRP